MKTPLTLSDLYPDLERVRFGSLLYHLLTDSAERSLLHRRHLNAVLSHAQYHGWIDVESFGRLRAGDDAVVLSILDELAIAWWLETAGYHLTFNPPGASGRVGELLIHSHPLSLWLEVKSLLPAEGAIIAQTMLALLDAIAASIHVSARLTVEIAHNPGGGVSQRELRRYIVGATQQLLAGAFPPPAYTHPSGVYLRALQCVPVPGLAHLQIQVLSDPWPGERDLALRSWRERLWRALRGGYSQLPHAGPPTLILVVDHTQPVAPASAWLTPFQELLRMGQHRYLSAVGRLIRDDLWLAQPALTLLLNPKALVQFPEHPLSPTLERRICVMPPTDYNTAHDD